MKAVATFSALERVAQCPGSVALPHAEYTTPASARGRALHAYLEAIPSLGGEAALDVVDDEWREAARALDLSGLDGALQLAPEVAFAYDVERDRARELGRGMRRAYADILPSEIPGTLDVVGVDVERRRGLVIDWKTGWAVGRKGIRQHWQLYAGGLVVARAYDLVEVEVQLVHVSEGAPRVQREVLSAFELDEFAADVADVYRRALEMRAQAEAGRIPDGLRAGEWCQYCPARDWCPVRTSLVRAAVAGDDVYDLLRVQPMPPSAVAEAYRRLKSAKKLLRHLEAAVYAAASEAPILVGTDDDGTEHWLGHVVDEGHEELDGAIVYAVIAARLGADVAREAVTYETTKASIDRAIKPRAARGQLAALKREILDEVRAHGGARRLIREGVREFTTQKGRRP
jgi:hypothetical protein